MDHVIFYFSRSLNVQPIGAVGLTMYELLLVLNSSMNNEYPNSSVVQDARLQGKAPKILNENLRNTLKKKEF